VTGYERRSLVLVLALCLSHWSSVALGEKADIKLLTPTISGSSGLFTLPVAETLRHGEFVLGLNSHRFNRDPGRLSFTVFPVSFTVGIHDQVELFGRVEAYKRVHGKDVLLYKVPPGGQLLPAFVASVNRLGYFNGSPFVDVPFGDGVGEFWIGAKFRFLSERGRGCLSLALQPVARFSSGNRQRRLRGLTSGALDVGVSLVASKELQRKGTLTGKAGFLSGRNVEGVDRQNQLGWGIGIEWPLIRRTLRVVGELAANTFIGDKESNLINPVSPIVTYGGARIRAFSWLTFSSAVSLDMRRVSDISTSSRFGWILQASFQRKINRPPKVECTSNRKSVVEGEAVRVRAKASDPDDDSLWLSWKSSGGRLSQENSSVVLDTSGLKAGRYSVMAEVGDDRSVASCSVDIEVKRRK